MAGNKMNTKAKGKEDKSKGGNTKSLGQNNEDAEETDFALLRKPILTSITGFGQARKIFDLATEELKDLLSNECDLLYECKVCRNIFRSLANFISHKRVYCKEKFNSSVHSHFIQSTSVVNEILKIKNLEQGYQDSLKESNETENNETEEFDDRVPLTKDLTAIVEKITINKGGHENNVDDMQIALQKIPNSSVAMFQNVQSSEEKSGENMRDEVSELDKMLSRDIAVLQNDGQFKIKSSITEETDSVIQISDDDDESGSNNILKCKICDMQFSTQKTLKFHMKYKHVESRLVYPCPDCLEIFSTSWSVYRHLFKVHRKTAAQIRRLRESIQAKAFKMNNPPAYYEKRKQTKMAAPQKITEEERLDQENQAWMDNMEGDGELPRCGGCGRTFERRAALAAHTHTCQPRSRALARRPHETKKIEIQIRKDYNKGPPANMNLPIKTTDANENKLPKEEPPQAASQSIKEESMPAAEEEKEAENDSMDVSEDDAKSNEASESPEKAPEKPVIASLKFLKLPFAHVAEKSNLAAFRQRIQTEVELDKLSCKKCDEKFTEAQDLYDHVAEHIKWLRYACKLCNYKNYRFDKLPEHVKVVHKLKGDTDFYYSTVKAINGTEALELCESTEELPDANETSPDSRRPSRCSSDSSRLSDDSSSSSTRVDGIARKRKLYQSKTSSKKRKEEKDGDVNLVENYSSSNIKNFEENSSDIDDIDAKKQMSNVDKSTVASRRPVRRKAKPKNEDFEYDLSNLLKMEAQGYRDSQTMAASTKTSQSKKKVQQEIQTNYDNLNKDCCGALITMSKKSVEIAGAHMKTFFPITCPPKDNRPPNIFVRPMLPKILSRGEKISPKKETNEDVKEQPSPSKDKEAITPNKTPEEESANLKESYTEKTCNGVANVNTQSSDSAVSASNGISTKGSSKPGEILKPKGIPPVLPIKFRRQSLEVVKNPIIKKNISDFTKSGMKTKILVIKPINRNKDGTQTLSTPLKFQTIKLKDPNKSASKEDKDQVVVVKVPKVECAKPRPITEVCSKSVPPPSPNETSAETAALGVSDDFKSVESINKDLSLTADETFTEPTDVNEISDKVDNTEIVQSEPNITEEVTTVNDNIIYVEDSISENVIAENVTPVV